jgi:hypothetical protein
MLGKIKNWFYQRALRQKLQENNAAHRSVSLTDAETVCIFFDAADEDGMVLVKKLVKQLQQQSKQVEAVGYLPKEKKDTNISLNYFTNKSVSWGNVPDDKLVEEYAERKFDLLLNLYVSDIKPLEYLSAVSNATCRVGMFKEQKSFYCDMMLALKPGDSLQTLIEQTETYLNQINSSNKNAATV